MFGRTKEVWQDLRRSLRIKDNLSVQWKVKDSHLRGQGRVLNISATGALLEAETSISPMERCVFALESLVKEKSYLPSEGRLVWSRHTGWGKKRVLCGVEFIKPSGEVLDSLQAHIQRGIARIKGARQARNILGAGLVLIMTAMTAFVITQYRQNYLSIQMSHDTLVGSYDQQIRLTQVYAKDILETRVLLEETRELLSQAKVENAVLTDQMAAKDSQYAASADAINKLQQRNTELSVELAALSSRLEFLEGNVSNAQEGRQAIAMYRQKMKEVKARIREFKREAYYAKAAAQKERDRLEMLAGNNGFLIKDGQPQKPDYKFGAGQPKIQVEVQK